MRIVVVGGGLAGLRSVENLKKLGYSGELVVISEEEHAPYNRTLLSKGFLTDHVGEEDLFLSSIPSGDGVSWRAGEKLTAANLAEKHLTLLSGETLLYDGLVIATGVRSRSPTNYEEQPAGTSLRNLEDAKDLKAKLSNTPRVMISGAGFIGCEVAAAARQMGCDVHVVSRSSVPMERVVGATVGAEIAKRHEENGIRFHFNDEVTDSRPESSGYVARLTRGDEIHFDLSLATLGSTPNVEWLEGNGLDLSDGVLCDTNLRVVGAPDAVAVGDVARFPVPQFSPNPRRVEHWQTAIDTAAHAMTELLFGFGYGSEPPHEFSMMPWFWSDQGEVRLTSFGLIAGDQDVVFLEGSLDSGCVLSYSSNGKTTGVLLVGLKEKSARYKRWLQNEMRDQAGVAHE